MKRLNELRGQHWLVLFAWLLAIGALANQGVTEARFIVRPQPKPFKIDNDVYAVHEWGVFPIARDAAWAKQDMLAEWSTFPSFFRGVLPGRKLFSPSELKPNHGIMIVTKPVVYFYNQKQTAIDMKVTFPDGRPVVWWPPAVEPASVTPGMTSKYLKFKCVATGPIGAKSPIGTALMRVPMPKVDSEHWLNHLRGVQSSRITVTGGVIPSSPGLGFAEQFIYYDGITYAPKSPAAKRVEGNVVLQTTSDHEWHDVLVIERLEGRVRVSGWLDKLSAGSHSTSFELRDVTKNEGAVIAQLKTQLHDRLDRAGLNRDEADALVKVWGPGLFEQDGLLVFYRISQKTYDRWLPLELSPKPSAVVRVGLVVHAHLEPELETRVKRYINALGDINFQVRMKADRSLVRIGGAAFKWIREGAKSADPEVAFRCERILRQYDAGRYIKEKNKLADDIGKK